MFNKLLFKIGYLLLFSGLLLTACTPAKIPLATTPEMAVYRSELADADAKALFAYSQFRMLAAENRWDEAIAALRRAATFDPEVLYLRMILAKALLHKDQAGDSIQILREILQEFPEFSEGHELLGDLLSYQEQYESAVEHYRRALKLNPESELLQMRLAMALGRLGLNLEAIQVLEVLVEKDPDAQQAQLSLARFYQAEAQNGRAKSIYQRLLSRHPNQYQTTLEYGKLLESEQLFAEAFELYRAGVRHNPRSIAIRQRLAMLYMKQQRLPEALEQLLAIRQQVPDNLEVLGRIGLIHLELQNWISAEADFRTLLEHGENHGRHRYYLGLALLGQGKNSEAIEVMSPINESSPIFAEAVLQLAYLYRQADRVEEAINALLSLLDLNISKPEVYYYLTSFYEEQDNLPEATQIAQQGLEKYPRDVDLLYQLGVLQEKAERRAMALETMQKILTIDADHPDALNYIAYYHAEEGTDLELALTRAQKALSAKKTGYIIDTLGWIYFKLGRYTESLEQLKEASSLHPDDAVILQHLGDLYRALRLWDKAAAAYRRALEINPQAEGVAEKLRNLPQELKP